MKQIKIDLAITGKKLLISFRFWSYLCCCLQYIWSASAEATAAIRSWRCWNRTDHPSLRLHLWQRAAETSRLWRSAALLVHIVTFCVTSKYVLSCSFSFNPMFYAVRFWSCLHSCSWLQSASAAIHSRTDIRWCSKVLSVWNNHHHLYSHLQSASTAAAIHSSHNHHHLYSHWELWRIWSNQHCRHFTGWGQQPAEGG